LLYTPRGKVGQELSEEEGYAAAKSAGLAVLGSLKRTSVISIASRHGFA
jgi:hypothetical protein